MTTNPQIEYLKQQLDVAYANYQTALQDFRSSSWWERIWGGNKTKVEQAKTALDEAQQNYMTAAGLASSEQSSSNSFVLPVVSAGIIAVIVLLIILKRKS